MRFTARGGWCSGHLRQPEYESGKRNGWKSLATSFGPALAQREGVFVRLASFALISSMLLVVGADLASAGTPKNTLRAKSRAFTMRTLSNKDRLSASGHISSIQTGRFAARLRAESTACSIGIQQAYAKNIGKLPLMRSVASKGGGVKFKVGPLTLIELGPIQSVTSKPGLSQRPVIGGLLVPRSERGRGKVRVEVKAAGAETIVKLELADYRSAIRGTKARAPIRQAVYEQTQLRIHRRVCNAFLRSLSRGLFLK